MSHRIYANNAAKGAIEMALHDLVGRATGQPAHALLGGKQRSRMPMLGVISTGELASDLREAESKKADGYAPSRSRSASTSRWSTPSAPGVSASCSDARLDLIRRQPGLERGGSGAICARGRGCRPRFLRAARPRRRHRRHGGGGGGSRHIAIGADESIHSLEDIRRLHRQRRARREPEDHQARRHARGDGGGPPVRRLGLKVNVAAKTGESSIACAAAVHIAAALPQIAWGLTLSNEGLTDDVTARPFASSTDMWKYRTARDLASTWMRTGCDAIGAMCRSGRWHEYKTQ